MESILAINVLEPEVLNIQCCDKHDDERIAQSQGFRKSWISMCQPDNTGACIGYCQAAAIQFCCKS